MRISIGEIDCPFSGLRDMADVIDISCCKILRATGNEKKRWNRSSLKKKMIDWAVTQGFIVGRAPIYANVLHESWYNFRGNKNIRLLH